MYKVTLYHFHPAYRKGDLEEDTTMELCEIFKTKKAAKAWVLSQVHNKKYHGIWHKGDTPSKVYYYTDLEWVNESSGEKRREYYSYLIVKTK